MMEEPPGQPKKKPKKPKTQVPWNLQRAQPGSHRVPGGAGGQDDPGDAACPGDVVSHGVHGGAGDLAGPRGPSAAGEPGGAAGAILQISGPPHAPGPSGNAAPGAAVVVTVTFGLYLFQEPWWARGRGGRVVGEVWFGGLQVVLKCRRRVLWGLGYGSGVRGQAAREDSEEKQPEGTRESGGDIRVSGGGLVGEGISVSREPVVRKQND